MEKNEKKENRKTLRTIITIIIIIIILLLLRSCGKKENESTATGNDSFVTSETATDSNPNEGKSLEKEINQIDEVKVEESEETEKQEEPADTKTVYSYYVNFLNIDGSVLQRTVVKTGETPVYNGEMPSYYDGTYNYSFVGWNRKINPVSFTQTYVAVYNKTEKATSSPAVVTEPAPTINAVPATTSFSYDGTEHELIVAGDVDGGTMEYKLEGGDYSTALPTAKDAGNYTVYYRVIGDEDHSDLPEASITAVLAKRAITVTSDSDSKIYDGDALTCGSLSYDVGSFISGEDGKGKLSFNFTGSQTDAGISDNTFTITSTVTNMNNYDITYVYGSLTVDKADAVITVDQSPISKTYGETLVLPTATSNFGTVSCDKTAADLVNVDSYTVTYSVDGTDNYNGDSKTVSVTINKADAVITVDQEPITKTYGEALVLPTATSNFGTVSCDKTAADLVNVDSYTVTYSVDGTNNYNGDSKTVSVTINKAAAPTIKGKESLVTNNSDQELVEAGDPGAGTWEYSLDGTNYSTAIPTGKDKGSYTVYYRNSGSQNYEAGSGSVSVVIGDPSLCFAAGSKVTMADGSHKNIEDIVEEDEVLTYNHEEGKYEAQKVFLVYQGEEPSDTFTLRFSNGGSVKISGEHDLFEKESLKYVTITDENAESFIGKHFYSVNEGKYVKLLKVTYNTEKVDYYSIYTEYNANCIVNGMLTVPDDDDERLNIYKFNEDLTIDHKQLAKDIAEFGLHEYEENEYYSEELFDSLCWKYVNLMVGKGYGTMEDFIARRNVFLGIEE